MRFADPRPDGRAIVYAAIQADPLVQRCADALAGATTGQRTLARAVMNGEPGEPGEWRVMFPTLFGSAVPAAERAASETLLALALEVAARGDETRSQVRGAIVEALAERLVARRTTRVRRERRVLFDGVPSEIHPYDLTVEPEQGMAEAWDCKWGARGIRADVLHQLDDARRHAADEGTALLVGLVVFDARRSCEVRLLRERGPVAAGAVKLVALEQLDRLAGGRAPA